MSYSAVVLSEGQSTDVVAPGAPAFVGITQTDNRYWQVDVQIPLTDADGSELTGLTRLVVATAPMVSGANPFEGLSMAEVLGLPGVVCYPVSLTPADAGTVKTVSAAIQNLGGWQAFAAAVADDEG